MIETFGNRTSVGGLVCRMGKVTASLNLEFVADQEELTLAVLLNQRKVGTFVFPRYTIEQLCSIIRRQLHDAGRARRIMVVT